MSHVIDPKFTPAIADQQGFLRPLQDPAIQALLATADADAQVPKYTVQRVVRLYLFAWMLPNLFHSLRGILRLRDNLLAQWFAGFSGWTLSGLSDANRRIPATVFQQIYARLSAHLRQHPLAQPQLAGQFGTLRIFDATYLRLCLRLIPWGKAQNQRATKGQMLLSLRLDQGGRIPEAINLDSTPAHCEIHFQHLIDWTQRQITYLFDRGYRRLGTLEAIHRSGNFFLTRWNQSVHLTILTPLRFEPETRDAVTITHDQLVRLGTGKKRTGVAFRLVTAQVLVREQLTPLWFLTNRFDLDAFEVAAIYRYRWEIEVFFKWLKSGLRINHFISCSENGVYAQIYLTLILHLLLAIYHHQHRLTEHMGIATQRDLVTHLIHLAFALGMAHACSRHPAADDGGGLSPPTQLGGGGLVNHDIINS